MTVDQLVHRLTLSTCEVDGYENLFDHLRNIVVAKVEQVAKHPDADRLSVCQVNAGKKLQIVTGATNIREGIRVALALPGAKIPTADGNIIDIQPSKLRGIDSSGMLCSIKELGLEKLADDNGGILILHDPENDGSDIPSLHLNCKDGTSLLDVLPLADTVLDIDNKSITHRPDLWCHYGFAREIAAIFKKKMKEHPLDQASFPEDPTLPTKTIQIQPGAAHAYRGVHMANVVVKQSPFWMQSRLVAIGQKPINNVVDASNYILFDIGQPNHAFDASQLKSNTISVVKNGHGKMHTGLALLDDRSIDPPEDAILILDGEMDSGRAVALGGIMGGKGFSIDESTASLFFESATFPRELIRRTISATQIRTDSSMRFEKGQDPLKAKPAIFRYTALLKETCPKIQLGTITGEEPSGPKRNVISTDLTFLQSRLGYAVTIKEVMNTLGGLGFEVKQVKPGNGLRITVPTYRSWYDVTIPEDIVEEMGRIHGYDNIAPRTPPVACMAVPPNRQRALERFTRTFFAQRAAFHETRNYSFATVEENLLSGQEGLRILNPTMTGRDRMRLSLVPGIVQQAASNQDRFDDVRLFESGRIYYRTPQLPEQEIAIEQRHVVLIHLPPADTATLNPESRSIYRAFLDLRESMEGYLTTVMGGASISALPPSGESGNADEKSSVENNIAFLHPGCAVKFLSGDNRTLGVAGIIHPAWENRFDLKRGAVVGLLYFDEVYRQYDAYRKQSDYSPPSVFPDSHFEFSVVIEDHISTALPRQIILDQKIPEIRSVDLLTVYRGAPLPEEKKSASYRVTCGRNDATLSGDQLQKILQQSIETLEKAGIPLR